MTSAIFVTVFLCMGLGLIWYSDFVFGRAWLEAIGKNKEDVEPYIARHAVSIIGWFSSSFVYALIISQSIMSNVQEFLFLSIALWGAFMMPAKAMSIVQGRFNTKVMWIDGMYHLIGYLIMALVFGYFVLGQ